MMCAILDRGIQHLIFIPNSWEIGAISSQREDMAGELITSEFKIPSLIKIAFYSTKNCMVITTNVPSSMKIGESLYIVSTLQTCIHRKPRRERSINEGSSHLLSVNRFPSRDQWLHTFVGLAFPATEASTETTLTHSGPLEDFWSHVFCRRLPILALLPLYHHQSSCHEVSPPSLCNI